nr:alpha/beta hydrolase fold [uncultured organism]
MSREQRKTVADALRAAGSGFAPSAISEMRDNFASMMSRFAIPPVSTTQVRVAERPAVLVEDLSDPRPGTILYFHGGSFVLGSPTTAMGLTASLVARTRMRAISVDYRLAPEHPFPAAIEDCLAAYRSILEEGIPAQSIAFAGDSAGGGLAVTTTLAARAAGLPLPAAILAFSPGLDLTRTGASVTDKADRDPFFTREGLDYTGGLYLAGQSPDQDLASPAVLADLSGFPPMLLQVGTDELMLDDSVRLADRAREADVDVILDITANVPHVFQSLSGQLEEADWALDRAALFLTQHVDAIFTDEG